MEDRTPRRGALLFLCGFGAVFLIALTSLLLTSHPTQTLLEKIYRSIGLFTGNSSWAFDKAVRPPPPFIFRLLAVIAPFVSAFGLVELVTGRAGSDWLCIRAATLVLLRRRDPTAIFGLDASSLVFARSLVARSSRDLPVVFDAALPHALVELCHRDNIPVLPFPWARSIHKERQRAPTSIASLLLRSARSHVFFFAGADEQMRCVQELDEWLRDQPPELAGERRTAWLLMSQPGLRQLLGSYQRFSQARLQLQLFDINLLAARQLLWKHRLDAWADVLGQDQIHIAIYGFGRLGRAIAKEAARYYVTRASIFGKKRKIRLTIIDQEPDAARGAFLADEPEIENVLLIETRKARLQPGGLASEQLRSTVPEHVTAHIITLNEPEWVLAQALSLRRWLLEPPADCGRDWFDAHRNAPIFVPVADWRGFGSLIRSGIDWPKGSPIPAEIPNAIFGFGATEDLLGQKSILCRDRALGGRALHEHYCNYLAERDPDRPAITAWSDLAPNLRQSNMLAFDHSWVKARATGYRIIELPAHQTKHFPAFDMDEQLLLSRLEHKRYLAERIADGWRRADARCDAIRVHPDLCEFDELSPSEQQIDNNLIEALPAALFAVRKRLVKGHVVGIVGHRLLDARDQRSGAECYPRLQEVAVRSSLNGALRELRGRHPGTVLLSALATGADTWAVEEARSLGIPWIVVLPLPFELYGDDFSAAAMGKATATGSTSWNDTFRALVAEAEYYFELPLTAGRASQMSRGGGKHPADETSARARDAQYAMAGRYIVERSDTLLAVWDGVAARGDGGTGALVEYRLSLAREARTGKVLAGSHFFPTPAMTLPEIYRPDGTRQAQQADASERA